MFFFNTLYIQRVLGYTPLEAGLAFLPFTAGIMVSAGLASTFAPKIGVRPVAAVGMILTAVGLAAARRSCRWTARTSPTCCRRCSLTSLGMGAVFMPLTLVATTGLRQRGPGARVRACSTRRSRSAARSASRSCRRSRPAARPRPAARAIRRARARLPLRLRGRRRVRARRARRDAVRLRAPRRRADRGRGGRQAGARQAPSVVSSRRRSAQPRPRPRRRGRGASPSAAPT